VIVTDTEGHRFRLSEAGKKVTLEQDATPRAETPSWAPVSCEQTTLRSTLAAMIEAIKSGS
jgi:hypothetical protein